jgi:hypothetical protein
MNDLSVGRAAFYPSRVVLANLLGLNLSEIRNADYGSRVDSKMGLI